MARVALFLVAALWLLFGDGLAVAAPVPADVKATEPASAAVAVSAAPTDPVPIDTGPAEAAAADLSAPAVNPIPGGGADAAVEAAAGSGEAAAPIPGLTQEAVAAAGPISDETAHDPPRYNGATAITVSDHPVLPDTTAAPRKVLVLEDSGKDDGIKTVKDVILPLAPEHKAYQAEMMDTRKLAKEADERASALRRAAAQARLRAQKEISDMEVYRQIAIKNTNSYTSATIPDIAESTNGPDAMSSEEAQAATRRANEAQQDAITAEFHASQTTTFAHDLSDKALAMAIFMGKVQKSDKLEAKAQLKEALAAVDQEATEKKLDALSKDKSVLEEAVEHDKQTAEQFADQSYLDFDTVNLANQAMQEAHDVVKHAQEKERASENAYHVAQAEAERTKAIADKARAKANGAHAEAASNQGQVYCDDVGCRLVSIQAGPGGTPTLPKDSSEIELLSKWKQASMQQKASVEDMAKSEKAMQQAQITADNSFYQDLEARRKALLDKDRLAIEAIRGKHEVDPGEDDDGTGAEVGDTAGGRSHHERGEREGGDDDEDATSSEAKEANEERREDIQDAKEDKEDRIAVDEAFGDTQKEAEDEEAQAAEDDRIFQSEVDRRDRQAEQEAQIEDRKKEDGLITEEKMDKKEEAEVPRAQRDEREILDAKKETQDEEDMTKEEYTRNTQYVQHADQEYQQEEAALQTIRVKEKKDLAKEKEEIQDDKAAEYALEQDDLKREGSAKDKEQGEEWRNADIRHEREEEVADEEKEMKEVQADRAEEAEEFRKAKEQLEDDTTQGGRSPVGPAKEDEASPIEYGSTGSGPKEWDTGAAHESNKHDYGAYGGGVGHIGLAGGKGAHGYGIDAYKGKEHDFAGDKANFGGKPGFGDSNIAYNPMQSHSPKGIDSKEWAGGYRDNEEGGTPTEWASYEHAVDEEAGATNTVKETDDLGGKPPQEMLHVECVDCQTAAPVVVKVKYTVPEGADVSSDSVFVLAIVSEELKESGKDWFFWVPKPPKSWSIVLSPATAGPVRDDVVAFDDDKVPIIAFRLTHAVAAGTTLEMTFTDVFMSPGGYVRESLFAVKFGVLKGDLPRSARKCLTSGDQSDLAPDSIMIADGYFKVPSLGLGKDIADDVHPEDDPSLLASDGIKVELSENVAQDTPTIVVTARVPNGFAMKPTFNVGLYIFSPALKAAGNPNYCFEVRDPPSAWGAEAEGLGRPHNSTVVYSPTDRKCGIAVMSGFDKISLTDNSFRITLENAFTIPGSFDVVTTFLAVLAVHEKPVTGKMVDSVTSFTGGATYYAIREFPVLAHREVDPADEIHQANTTAVAQNTKTEQDPGIKLHSSSVIALPPMPSSASQRNGGAGTSLFTTSNVGSSSDKTQGGTTLWSVSTVSSSPALSGPSPFTVLLAALAVIFAVFLQ